MTNLIIPDRIDAELQAIHFFTGPSERVFSNREERFAQLCVVLGGRYRASVIFGKKSQQIHALPGDVLFWSAGTQRVEESVPNQPLRAISIYLKWGGVPQGLPAMVHDIHQVIHFLADRLLALSHDPARKQVMERIGVAYLHAILAEYLSLADAAESNLELLVRRYAEMHVREPIRLTALARHTGLSVSHFCRTYKHLTGRSPIRDVQQRKAAHAKMMLLQQPRMKLETAAMRVGVKDAATLCRLLKRHTGMTIRDIRSLARTADRS